MSAMFQETVKKMADMLLEKSKLYGSGHIYMERSPYKANADPRHKFSRELPWDMTPGSHWEVVGDGTIDGSRLVMKTIDDEGNA